MAWSVGPTLTRLGASLQQVTDGPEPILKRAAGGGSLDAGCHWHVSHAWQDIRQAEPAQRCSYA